MRAILPGMAQWRRRVKRPPHLGGMYGEVSCTESASSNMLRADARSATRSTTANRVAHRADPAQQHGRGTQVSMTDLHSCVSPGMPDEDVNEVHE
jgi:hypothetical protein